MIKKIIFWSSIIFIVITLFPHLSESQQAEKPKVSAAGSSLVVANQGILPNSGPVEVIGLNIESEIGGNLTSVTVRIISDEKGIGSSPLASDFTRIVLYKDGGKNGVFDSSDIITERRLVSVTGPFENLGAISLIPSEPTPLPLTDKGAFTGDDFFITIETSSTLGVIPGTNFPRQTRFVVEIPEGGVALTVPLEEPFKGVRTEALTVDAFTFDLTPLARNRPDTLLPFFPGGPTNFGRYPYAAPNELTRIRPDVEPTDIEEAFIVHELAQLLPVEKRTSVLGISLGGGSKNNPVDIEEIILTLRDHGADGSFNPVIGLDPVYPNSFLEGVSNNIKVAGIALYEDTNNNGVFDENDDAPFVLQRDARRVSPFAPFPPNNDPADDIDPTTGGINFIDADGKPNGPSSPWRITLRPVRSDKIPSEPPRIPTTVDSLDFVEIHPDYFIVIRADSGYIDDSGLFGDGVGIGFGADFTIDLTSITLRGIGGTKISSSPSSNIPSLTPVETKVITPLIEIHDLVLDYGLEKINVPLTEGSRMTQSINAASSFVPIIGINVVDSDNPVTIRFIDAFIEAIRVDIKAGQGFETSDLIPLAPTGNSGIALFRDNKGEGKIGVFDSSDEQIPLINPSYRTDTTGTYVILEPLEALEFPNDDKFDGLNRGDDYFVCVKTSDTISYQDKFGLSIPPGGIQFGPGGNLSPGGEEATDPDENLDFGGTDEEDFAIAPAEVREITANVPTFLKNLVAEGQTIVPLSPPTAVIGINCSLPGKSTIPYQGSDVFLEYMVVEFYNQEISNFIPEEDLLPFSTEPQSGVAIYRDNDTGGTNGVFDPDVDIPIKLDFPPRFIGEIGEVPKQVELVFSSDQNKQPVPRNDLGDNKGNDFFVVIRTSSQISPGDSFAVGLVDWGPETPSQLAPHEGRGEAIKKFKKDNLNVFMEYPFGSRALGFVDANKRRSRSTAQIETHVLTVSLLETIPPKIPEETPEARRPSPQPPPTGLLITRPSVRINPSVVSSLAPFDLEITLFLPKGPSSVTKETISFNGIESEVKFIDKFDFSRDLTRGILIIPNLQLTAEANGVYIYTITTSQGVARARLRISIPSGPLGIFLSPTS